MPVAAAVPYLAAAAVGAGTAAAANSQNKRSTTQAPNYGAVNTQGVQNDASTLPFRLQINQAAQTGSAYTDPSTGQVYDFRGQFDANRFFAQNPQAKAQYDAENHAAGTIRDPQSFAHDYLINNGKAEGAINDYYTGSQTYRNQSDINSAVQLGQAGADISDASARRQLQTQLDLLPQFNQLNNQQQQATIDQMLAASQKFTQNQFDQNLKYLPQLNALQLQGQNDAWNASLAAGKAGTYAMADWQKDLLPGINDLSLQQQRKAFDASQAASTTAFRGNLDQADEAAARAAALQSRTLPGLNDLSLRLQGDAYRAGDTAGRAVNPGLYNVRDTMARQLGEELAAGGDLTAAQRHKVQQNIRGAQAARGNILGDGAGFDEAIAESDYAQNLINDRRSAALGLLNSRDLAPGFSALGVVNPTQVVAPNLAPANFQAQTASFNPLMPNFSASPMLQPTVPNFTSTTAQMPNVQPSTINLSNPLGMLNPNAGNASANYNLNAWNSQQGRAANAPNPWMQGLGSAFKGYAAFAG